MSSRRVYSAAVVLSSGKVLVSGGFGDDIASAELYDPATSTWAATGRMIGGRYSHSATVLSSGKVLVAGGENGSPIASAELYDPASGTWSAAASMTVPHANHAAVLLPSGKVLVIGGRNVSQQAEVYNPATNTWAVTSPLNDYHDEGFSAVLLSTGKVLVIGGRYGTTSAELYDPATNGWTRTGSLINGRMYHTATLLPSGKVLAAGGESQNHVPTASAELYDPSSGTWTATASLSAPRYYHSASLVAGNVLVAGGTSQDPFSSPALTTAEVYDPATSTWSAVAAVPHPHFNQVAVSLPGGALLIGGFDGSPLRTADFFTGTSCASGAACTPSNVCQTGAISCATGQPVCVPTGSAAYGTSCGSGRACDGSSSCCDGKYGTHASQWLQWSAYTHYVFRNGWCLVPDPNVPSGCYGNIWVISQHLASAYCSTVGSGGSCYDGDAIWYATCSGLVDSQFDCAGGLVPVSCSP